MNIYIRSAACISPQQSFGRPLLSPVTYPGGRLKCIEPDYKTLLDPKLFRRMSRIIRMGAATAMACLQEAGEADPGAIVTGTAYGCLEDTGIFLDSIIGRSEEMLQPATFIQSTHNTVGAQIALMLQCTGYNNSFVHRGLSFESALLDAILLLRDDEAATVLAGAVDEITDTSFELLSRFGLYRHGSAPGEGTAGEGAAGEGAAFFLLAGQPGDKDLCRLDGLTTLYKPKEKNEIERHLRSFLAAHDLGMEMIDLVITGDNRHFFDDCPTMPYKQFCGEYPTSAAFALWLAASKIHSGLGRILIYNNYLNIHHSAILVSSAQNPSAQNPSVQNPSVQNPSSCY